MFTTVENSAESISLRWSKWLRSREAFWMSKVDIFVYYEIVYYEIKKQKTYVSCI